MESTQSPWLPESALPNLNPPAHLLPWLTDRGSMTARLKAHCGTYTLKITHHEWAMATPDELALLNIDPREPTIIRDVVQSCDGKPAVMGHSIFPKSSLIGALAPLKTLGTRPIGDLIFHHPTLERSAFQYRVNPNDNLWSRRSILSVENKPILVTETFLPQGLRTDALKKKMETRV